MRHHKMISHDPDGLRNRRYTRYVCLLLITLLLCLLTACRDGGGTDETEAMTTEAPSASPDAPVTEPTTDGETEPVTAPAETEPPVEYIDRSEFSIDHAGAKTDTVLYAKDYGAVGDGVTDDGPAISAAVRDAMEKQATLQFEAGKTYLMLTSTNSAGMFHGPMAMAGASGVTLDGNGSTFKIAPGDCYFTLHGCSDIRICNMRFDYIAPVYLVGTVRETKAGGVVVFDTDTEPYKDDYNYAGAVAFSIRYNEGTQARPHMYLDRMTRVGERCVEVKYRNGHNYKVGEKVFLPNPGIGHVWSEVIYMGSNSGSVTLSNIQILAAPSFVFAIKGNDCEMYFDNVDLMPAEDDTREIQMVAWRDGFHCKDNRRPFHWNECDVKGLFDDVYNVSNTLGYITSVDNDAKLSAVNYEFYIRGQNVPFDCRVGDVVDVFEPSRGSYGGSAIVREVITNPDQSRTVILEYGQAFDEPEAGWLIANRDTCAPGSTITNCRFEGTFRAKRNIRIENTTFDMLATWINVGDDVEGPVPGNIDFVNCTFNGGSMEIKTRKARIAAAVTDIGFWGCTFNNMGRSISGQSKVSFADTWTEAELYTMLNRRVRTRAVEITPNELDIINGVCYDWTRYTMQIPGGTVVRMEDITDANIRDKLTTADTFADHALVLTGTAEQTRFVLGGLDPAHIPALYVDGGFHIMTMEYYIATEASISVGYLAGDTATVIGENLFTEIGLPARATCLYYGSNSHTGLYIDVPAGVTVYIGFVEISLASGQNPTDSQLEDGHTFAWSAVPGPGVNIGPIGVAMKIEDIPDATAKAAILEAKNGFSSGTVLHMTGAFGAFTGLTDPAYYKPGRTYHLSLDAYIASPLKPKNGTKIYLLALDSTPGNRVLAEGMFTGEGFYHFEMDWTVGNTGENSLMFYVSNTPDAYPDVYIGDFTVTLSVPQTPGAFLSRTDYHVLTEDELKQGYTYDFTEGNLQDMTHAKYADISEVRRKTKEILIANGFGDTVYYCNEGFMLQSIPDELVGEQTLRIRFQVYDLLGNLSTFEGTSGGNSAFVMLRMKDGKQDGSSVSFTVIPSETNDRLMTLEFVTTTAENVTDLMFLPLTSIEFFIGSITISNE